jgi:hypothetical protein
LCTATIDSNGNASCTTSAALAPGTYSVTATYGGDTNYSGSTASTSFMITKAATSMTVTSSQNPAAPGQPITYTATVSPNPGSGTVTFTDNGVAISGCTAVPIDPATGKATCSTTYPSSGSHVIAAAYSGNSQYQGTSTPTSGVDALTETIQAAVPVPTTGAGAPGAWATLWCLAAGLLMSLLLSLRMVLSRRPRT